MANLSNPHYSSHQILSGQYAQLGEFVLSDGSDYEGLFHVLPNNRQFTGPNPTDSSKELFTKQIDSSPDVTKFNQINNVTTSRYVSPSLYIAIPTSDDIQSGRMLRYFVQRRNNPLNTILEVDEEQFASINFSNRKGINGTLWNSVSLFWQIVGRDAQQIVDLNSKQIQHASLTFPGLGHYLEDLLQFYI